MKIDLKFIIILIGIYPVFVFLLKREWFIQKNIFINMILLNAILFFSSFVIPESILDKFSLAILRFPIIYLVLYRLMHFIYVKLFNAEPINTMFSMKRGIWKDAVFNIIFWLLSGMLLMLSFYILQ